MNTRMAAHARAVAYGRDGVRLPVAAQAAASDAAARSVVSSAVLMENAGRAAAQILQKLHPRGRILGFAGSGNNGGDLLVMMRALHEWGRDVTILTAGAREPDMGLLHGHPIDVHRFADFPRDITADIIVDGILGTGSSGAPRGVAAGAIRVINAMSRPVVALDLPSGADATTGGVHDNVVNATTTICFGWPKLGVLLFPARRHCGRILAVEIGFPPGSDASFTGEAITSCWAAARLPHRAPDAHKGSSGNLLIVAGQNGMAGAALLCARAAVRSGAGLVRIASDAANRSILQLAVPEAIFVDRSELDEDQIRASTAIVVGPGVGQDEHARAALDRVLSHGAGIPLLLDADALNMLSHEETALTRAALDRPMLLTPHPRELGRLLHRATDEITRDRVTAAAEAAERFGAVVLVKGQPSLVASPAAADSESAEPMLVNTMITSDVAAAGMGDQLSGVIGGLMAAGAAPRSAAGLGLYYAGRAAHIAHRGRSLSPQDVSDALGDAFLERISSRSSLDLPFITFDQNAVA
jgi:NAD(P)H-hydrate epimerase